MTSLAELAADIGNLFGLSGVVSDMGQLVMAAGWATASVVAADLAFQKIAFLRGFSPFVQDFGAIAAGFIGGTLAGRVSQAAGLGIGTGLITWGLARLVKYGLNKFVFTDATPGSWRAPLAGGAFAGPGDDLLLGLAALQTRDLTLIPGQTDLRGMFGITTRDQQPAYPGGPLAAAVLQ